MSSCRLSRICIVFPLLLNIYLLDVSMAFRSKRCNTTISQRPFPELRASRFKLLSNAQLDRHEICTIMSVYRLSDCLQLCTKQVDCVSFTFNREGRTCQLKNATSSLFPDDKVQKTDPAIRHYESLISKEVRIRSGREVYSVENCMYIMCF